MSLLVNITEYSGRLYLLYVMALLIKHRSILFSVIVPVLSVAMTVVLPKVSAARRRFTNALFLESWKAPTPRTIVMIMGSSSGMVANDSDNPYRIACSGVRGIGWVSPRR